MAPPKVTLWEGECHFGALGGRSHLLRFQRVAGTLKSIRCITSAKVLLKSAQIVNSFSAFDTGCGCQFQCQPVCSWSPAITGCAVPAKHVDGRCSAFNPQPTDRCARMPSFSTSTISARYSQSKCSRFFALTVAKSSATSRIPSWPTSCADAPRSWAGIYQPIRSQGLKWGLATPDSCDGLNRKFPG
jgi:hypothetical protein